jgi:leader peptidase (prepilin peptidase)/N-methyltransferase
LDNGWLDSGAILAEWWWLVGAALGLCVGSFLNVVVHRYPRMFERDMRREASEILAGEPSATPAPDGYTLALPRSACPACGHGISAMENLPVVSWLWLRGRCAGCGTAISPRYPLVEATTALMTLVVLWAVGVNAAGFAAVLLTWWLIPLALIDADTYYLPDAMTLPLLWLGLLLNTQSVLVDLESAVWGAIAGYLSLWSVFQLFKLLTGKEGMGFGDFKLLAALGAWLGWQSLPTIVILSSFVGAAVGIALIAFAGRDRARPIPFGPYLAAAGWLTLVWGEDIRRFYFGILGS